ncbi:hypothetical protein HJFPF1_03139 [Paramyrothecium foliicola]|nr:hypothetical protein HJFPF1_03139 [Paramyrothecium foliicola]
MPSDEGERRTVRVGERRKIESAASSLSSFWLADLRIGIFFLNDRRIIESWASKGLGGIPGHFVFLSATDQAKVQLHKADKSQDMFPSTKNLGESHRLRWSQ